MNIAEYAVDRECWGKMSIFDQMGNIYSEVGRSINAKKLGNNEDCEKAVVRALDLFDATVDALVSVKSPKTKEVLRAKDQYLDSLYGPQPSPKKFSDIDRYFMQYAIAARLNR